MTGTRRAKARPFRHTPSELAVLGRAHAAMMTNIRAGMSYDVVKLAWVKTEDLTIKQADGPR